MTLRGPLTFVLSFLLTWQAHAEVYVRTFCGKPYVGESGLDTNNTAQTTALQQSLQPSFVRITITNKSPYTDSQIAMNSGYNIIAILGVADTNNLTQSNLLVNICQNYSNSFWGVDVANEPDAAWSSGSVPTNSIGVTNYSALISMDRSILNANGLSGKLRLVGPSTSNDGSTYSNFCATLNALGTLSMLDVQGAHDYFACPGNGSCVNAGPYTSPNTAESNSGLTLAGRLALMQYWRAVSGSTNLVVLEEYGLYNGNLADAVTASQAFSTNNCVAILNAPSGVVGTCPWANQMPNGTWSLAIGYLMGWPCSK